MTESILKIDRPPPAVGGWDIGGVRFMVTRRPTWLARWCAKHLLGWEWRAAERRE